MNLYFKRFSVIIFFFGVNNAISDFFFFRIMSLEEEIILKKVKLVIIDSVASVVRKEFDTKLQGNLAERSNFLTRGASVLKYLAEEFSIPVSSSSFSKFFALQYQVIEKKGNDRKKKPDSDSCRNL